jgi:hypothetical protein
VPVNVVSMIAPVDRQRAMISPSRQTSASRLRHDGPLPDDMLADPATAGSGWLSPQVGAESRARRA